MSIADASLGGPAGVHARDGHSQTQEPCGENGWGIRARSRCCGHGIRTELQHLNVPLVVRGPKLNTVLQVRPHQCRVQGHDPLPAPAGHTVPDTSQDAVSLLGHLGTHCWNVPSETLLSFWL